MALLRKTGVMFNGATPHASSLVYIDTFVAVRFFDPRKTALPQIPIQLTDHDVISPLINRDSSVFVVLCSGRR